VVKRNSTRRSAAGRAVDSARKWRMHRGRPSRAEKAVHFGDVLGHAVWRFFPRRGDA
jgi:hypothetical protein